MRQFFDALKSLVNVLSWQSVLVVSIFGALLLVTASVQATSGISGVYAAVTNFVREEEIIAPRGLFYDAGGYPLVRNDLMWEISFPKNSVDEPALQSLPSLLAGIVQIDYADFLLRWQSAEQDAQVTLISGLSTSQIIQISSALTDYDYKVKKALQREYLYPAEFAHVIGFTGSPSESGLNPMEQVGKYRLEKVWDAFLHGINGSLVKEGSREIYYPEAPGNNVFLTIDLQWQRSLYALIANQVEVVGGKSGAGVILDSNSGDILAAVSYPNYDPNMFTQGISQATYNGLLSDPDKPLVDKLLNSPSAPGSSYKILTALTLLQHGTVDRNTHVFSTGCMEISAGFPFCEYGKYFLGDLDIIRAITRSSNIFFCENMLKLYAQSGFEPFTALASQLGMGKPTGLNVDTESGGSLASPELKAEKLGQDWYLGDVCNAIIGQGFTEVTPLQMAAMLAAIANGGDYYRPNLVSKIAEQDGTAIQVFSPEILRHVEISSEAREIILAGMRQAVTSPEGTAYRFLQGLPGDFRAKTGSAESYEMINGVPQPRVNGWVVGLFNYNNKEYAFAFTITHGGGGWNVTQVMQRFATCLFSGFSSNCAT